MNRSISNIGWLAEDDLRVYEWMKDMGFSGLEIAPTRIFPSAPYDNVSAARDWAAQIKHEHGFAIPSMQSIWYGRSENVFGSSEERAALIDYTKKAVDFAEAIGCGNLVFGCPRNRSMPEGAKSEDALAFFREIGAYAVAHHCVIALEANPPIYNTNFMNTTEQALEFIQLVDSDGFRLNLDVGTMLENGESVAVLAGKERYINHVHISEPGLKPIEKRSLHMELADLLRTVKYNGFVSIEVGKQERAEALVPMMKYVEEIFG